MEEYYASSKPPIFRVFIAIAIILALGPVSFFTVGPIAAHTNNPMINRWYDRNTAIGVCIFLSNPVVLFLANRLHRWVSRGAIRWVLVALQWVLVAAFLLHLTTPWYPVITTGWNTHDTAIIEHPIFATCLYLSALLSGILWVTFRSDRRLKLRMFYEFFPFALLVAGRIWLAVATRPQFTWG